jgi:acyl-CoA reductase-like NAD-dependent aldehyde dehydrogenase
MTILTFDTHRFVIELQKSGFSTEQAEGINNALGTALQTADVATKSDLRNAINEIKADAADQRTKIIQWLAALMIGQAAAITALMKMLG